MAKKNQLTKSDYLPMEEYKKLLRLLHKDRQYLWELYARLAFCTALRVSDVLSLAWADILHKGSLTKIEKKTGKVRKIPFNLSIQTRIEGLIFIKYRSCHRQHRNVTHDFCLLPVLPYPKFPFIVFYQVFRR